MKKRLLFLSAKSSEITFILTARNMGYHVITTGYKKDLPGHYYADEYLPFDYSDYDGMVDLVKKNEITAISHGCNDFCALSAAYIGEKMGFKGHDTYKNAEIFHRKDAFKKYALKSNIRTPQSKCFASVDEAMEYEIEKKMPVIVKPVDLAGGVGVSIAENRKEYEKALLNARELSKNTGIIVEPFIEGTLHSLSTFIIDKKVRAYGTANDYSYKNKYLTNTGVFPADNWQEDIKYLLPEVERIAKELDIVDGLLHLQYILDKSGNPWIIEMMRRSPGNNFTLPLSESTGINWREWIIRAEAGENLYGFPERKPVGKGFYGYHSVMASHNGIYKGIGISDKIRKSLYQFEQWHESGYVVNDYMNDKFANVQFYFSKEDKGKYVQKMNELVCPIIDEV